jgi:hypothetical protein
MWWPNMEQEQCSLEAADVSRPKRNDDDEYNRSVLGFSSMYGVQSSSPSTQKTLLVSEETKAEPIIRKDDLENSIASLKNGGGQNQRKRQKRAEKPPYSYIALIVMAIQNQSAKKAR